MNMFNQVTILQQISDVDRAIERVCERRFDATQATSGKLNVERRTLLQALQDRFDQRKAEFKAFRVGPSNQRHAHRLVLRMGQAHTDLVTYSLRGTVHPWA